MRTKVLTQFTIQNITTTSISFVYVDQQFNIVAQNIKPWHCIPFSRSVRNYQEQLDFICFSKVKDFWCTLQSYCNIYNQSSLHSPSRPFIKINQQKLLIKKSSNHKHNDICDLCSSFTLIMKLILINVKIYRLANQNRVHLHTNVKGMETNELI